MGQVARGRRCQPVVGEDERVAGPARVVVVGGGVAGLAAAFALTREAPAGTAITVVDGARRLGGKLHTTELAGRAVDEGAEAFLVRIPDAVDLVGQLGLADRLVAPATTAAGVYVGGQVRALPGGTLLGVPSSTAGLSAVLSPAAVRTVGDEATRPGEPLTGDVAVGTLVTARLGREVNDVLVDPLLGGVYAGRADGLSLRATMPALADRLTDRRVGLVEGARQVLAATSGPPAGEPVFGTLVGGLGVLVDALDTALRRAGVTVRTGLPVREMRRTPSGFRLLGGPVPEPSVLDAEAVVVATPAAPAARLLAGVAPAAAAELSTIDYASVAVVTLAYRGGLRLPPGSGVLVPAAPDRLVKAVTFVSAKWPHLAGPHTFVRASVGRAGESAALHRDDPDLVAAVTAELARLFGVAGRPLVARVTRWGGALPQYAVGHADRVGRIFAAVQAVPGLAVAGAAYRGVGIPACIGSGRAAAARVAASLAAAGTGGGESAHG